MTLSVRSTGKGKKIQRHHTKRSMGNPRFAAHLFDWTGVKKAILEGAKGQINQTTADLLSLGPT